MLTLEDCLLAEREIFQQDEFKTLAIMTYELGAVAQRLIRAESAPDTTEVNAHVANAIIEIADLVTQAGILMHKLYEKHPTVQLRLSWEELVEAGRERLLEQLTAYKTSLSREASLSTDNKED